MRVTVTLAIMLAAPLAQSQEVAAEMQPFEFLVGQWEGPAWYMAPNGERVDVIQTEDVFPAAGGHVLVVQGTGYLRQADGTPGEVAFEAFGVLSYDPATRTHYVDAFRDGQHIRTEATPIESGFDWGFEAQGRRVRYEMRRDAEGRWVETGHVMVAPERWVPFVEMTLGRVGS
jgi:hypothetical protein